MHEMTNAGRFAAAQQELTAIRRARVAASICRIAALQPIRAIGAHGGEYFVLAENVGTEHRPLWVSLSISPLDDGQPELLMCGNGQPVAFTDAEVLELAPLLGLLMGNLEFIPAAQVCARTVTH